MANIIESQVTLEDEVFEETIDVAEEPIEVIRPSSYNDLQDLPQVNGVTLQGNKTSSDLGIVTQNDINSAVSAEATLRENADTALGGRIDQEIADRGNADTALGGRIDGEITNRTNADNALGTRIDNEILARQGGDNNLQTQIDAITSKSDVVDVVATYADLQAYDTQHLGNNDVIKVLDDETHDHSQTYYRWNKPNSTWTYIGSEAPYYSKSQIDTQMAQKQDKLVAGSNIQIASDGKTISATDTNYTAGTGLTLTGTEFSADTTVLATKTEVSPKLQTEVVAELPTTGEESKLYLTPKNYTTGTATGNPITISLGEDAGQVTDAKLDGDTYQQSYTGKNLMPLANLENSGITSTYDYHTGVLHSSGKATANYPRLVEKTAFTIPSGTNYTLSVQETHDYTIHLRLYYSNTQYEASAITAGATSVSNTTSNNITHIEVLYQTGTNTEIDEDFKVQLELSSSATSFEPYCGGVPSPSPDFPQQIQTVTGTQTISINGTNYPISLGSIELCKLGDYQDYIYKSGSDWKVHKETKSVTLDENGDWAKREYGTNAYHVLHPDISTAQSKICIASQYFRGVSYDDRTNNQSNVIFADSNAGMSVDTRGITIRNTPWSDLSSFLSWISGKAIECLYVPLESTDTTITNQTLITQLEAVRTASLQASNTITNTATGTNLAGDLELGYYEFDPQNRYDKWIWLDLNNNYEKLGS